MTFCEDEEIARGLVPAQWVQDINRIVYLIGLAGIPLLVAASIVWGEPRMIMAACVWAVMAVWSFWGSFRLLVSLNGTLLTWRESIRWGGAETVLLAYLALPALFAGCFGFIYGLLYVLNALGFLKD